MAPLIQTIINHAWFRDAKDDGVVHPEFSDGGKLSLVTLAFVLTVVCLHVLTEMFSHLFHPLRSKIVLMNGPQDCTRKSNSHRMFTRRSTEKQTAQHGIVP